MLVSRVHPAAPSCTALHNVLYLFLVFESDYKLEAYSSIDLAWYSLLVSALI